MPPRTVILMSDLESDSEPGPSPPVQEPPPPPPPTGTSIRRVVFLDSDSEPESEPASIPLLQTRLPFHPPARTLNDSLPYFRRNDIPRYLFRVYTPKSCGETTASYVRPLSTTAPGHPEHQRLDIFASFHPDISSRYPDRVTDSRTTAELLRRHLYFSCRPNSSSDCPFVSWSSSLLFVLRYALCRMAYYDHADDNGGEVQPGMRTDWKDVKVILLDTTKLPRRTFISEVELLKFFTPHETPRRSRSLERLNGLRQYHHTEGYYFGEYLSQGDLKIAGACVQTDLHTLKAKGLFNLIPELNDEKQWGKHVVKNGGVLSLREKLYGSSAPATSEEPEIHQAIELGKLFCSQQLDLTVPAAAMFLALRKRLPHDPTMLRVFKKTFTADDIDAFQLAETNVPTELSLPEVSQFRILIENIQEHFDYLGYVEGQFTDGDTEEDESIDGVTDTLERLNFSLDTDDSS
ncbi:hypothetical protein QBC41DRAFT_366635 [Cercophora samala]|uniref:DUF7587 domain-containing protein n=1 Tax=Cercophora samala TaxID=330535 RepID=A0AA39Z9L9_9PEZI|nr:hypothetical protein QBC41DRAFT_366635 [Cercophora samala]